MILILVMDCTGDGSGWKLEGVEGTDELLDDLCDCITLERPSLIVGNFYAELHDGYIAKPHGYLGKMHGYRCIKHEDAMLRVLLTI